MFKFPVNRWSLSSWNKKKIRNHHPSAWMTTASDGLFLSSKPIQIQKDIGSSLQDKIKDILEYQLFAVSSDNYTLFQCNVQLSAPIFHLSKYHRKMCSQVMRKGRKIVQLATQSLLFLHLYLQPPWKKILSCSTHWGHKNIFRTETVCSIWM